MLQPTLTTLINDTRLRPDAIAFCEESGANLIQTRAQYILIVQSGDTDEYRYWSRRKVDFDEVMKRAQKSLDKVTVKNG